MTSTETEVNVELIPIPKGTEPLNLMTGVFLKSVYFLDPELTKCAVSGVFKNRENGIGFLIKGRKGCIFWSYDTFCQLCDRFNEITLAFEGNYRCLVKIDSGVNIKINNIFGQQYAYVSDGEHSLALTRHEWNQLVVNVPQISRSLLDLFYLEPEIKSYIDQILLNKEYHTDQLPPHVADRLYSEVSLYNGGGS